IRDRTFLISSSLRGFGFTRLSIAGPSRRGRGSCARDYPRGRAVIKRYGVGASLGGALLRLDDQHHLADRSQLGARQEHPADNAALGLGPGESTGIVVGEGADENLLPVRAIQKENVVHPGASCFQSPIHRSFSAWKAALETVETSCSTTVNSPSDHRITE